ncbi:Uncharacterized protein PBTT_08971 [Plasmodiophora brassicae]
MDLAIRKVARRMASRSGSLRSAMSSWRSLVVARRRRFRAALRVVHGRLRRYLRRWRRRHRLRWAGRHLARSFRRLDAARAVRTWHRNALVAAAEASVADHALVRVEINGLALWLPRPTCPAPDPAGTAVPIPTSTMWLKTAGLYGIY